MVWRSQLPVGYRGIRRRVQRTSGDGRTSKQDHNREREEALSARVRLSAA
jgi:hypothetical protein